jgi:hypothetical protein
MKSKMGGECKAHRTDEKLIENLTGKPEEIR